MNKKQFILLIFSLSLLLSCSNKSDSGGNDGLNDYTYKEVDFTHVHCNDKFWASRLETVRTITVPYAFHKCEETGRINNFAIAAGLKEGIFKGSYPFDDSDVFKIMEGASFLLAVKPDAALDAYLDSLINLIGKAQEADGYLYTNRTIHDRNPESPLHPWLKEERWVTEWDNSHETYNAGHMYEAAVAHYLATGKRSFLDIAIKNADLMCQVFNPQGLCIAPGHQVIEMGLVKLYRVTGDKKYLELSHYFLEARGKSDRFDPESKDMFRNGKYWQDHLPVTQQKEAVGHAVRATYMYSAMADIAALMKDDAYMTAIDSIWSNIVEKKMYITGGIGSSSHGEAFGDNYELPNASAYCETCAAIGNCMFNHRMFMLHGDSKYIDVLERSLYNGVLSGLDLAGDKFFYPNPLEVGKNGQDRSPWFDCSCCPSNLSRFIPSVPSYMYATDNHSVYINLYAGNEAEIPYKDGVVHILQETNYPWNGNVKLTLKPEKTSKFDLKIRIPGWVTGQPVPSDLYGFSNNQANKAQIKVNGKSYDYKVEKGYAVIKSDWKSGDQVEIDMPMDIKLVKANPLVHADVDRVSVESGPIVYCAEFIDNGGETSNRTITTATAFSTTYEPQLLNGINVLKGKSTVYTPVKGTKEVNTSEGELTLIPYYARSHRGSGEMDVWIADNPELIRNKFLQAYQIVDEVIIADEHSEKEHRFQGSKTNFGKASGWLSGWRDAADGGWFSYDMEVVSNEPLELVLTYYSKDGGNRYFDILADNEKIGEQKLRTETYTDMIEKSYAIPTSITAGKKKITIKFKSIPGNIVGGIWGCRIQRVETK